MNRRKVTGHEFMNQIADAIGLPLNTRKVTLTAEVNRPVVLTIETVCREGECKTLQRVLDSCSFDSNETEQDQ